MRPLQRTRQTHKGAVNEEHNVISASDSSAARSEEEENCFTESMSDEMHHIHSKIPQMEAEWRGVSQQEDRCVTEQINQPLGIECRQTDCGHVSINRPRDTLTACGGIKKKKKKREYNEHE